MISLIREAVDAGVRQREACRVIGITERTLQRWQSQEHGGQDARRGPHTPSAHRLTEAEKDEVVAHSNRPGLRNLSAERVIAKLADEDIYVCSERSLRRIQKERNQANYRGRAKPATAVHKPREYAASEPLRVLSWDITYLRNASLRGAYFYLYLYVDVWSRRILGWAVHDEQTTEHAAALLRRVCRDFSIEADTAVLHQDNGAPMKGATFLATLNELGVTKSFSRPGVSDDNAFIESLFRHLKYVPSYPRRGFPNIADAAKWVAHFVEWYNSEHLHSAIGYVTPDDRHNGRDIEILIKRQRLYDEARQRHPRRWSGQRRKWNRPMIVTLNPERTLEARPASRERAA